MEPTQENPVAASETDALRQANEALQLEIQSRRAQITALEKTAAERDAELAAARHTLAETMQKLDAAGQARLQAVTAYKELVIRNNPGIIAEMVSGDNIETVNTSLENAKTLVSRVRQEVGAENAKARVPAGAPRRSPPDLTALTPREKIKYAMEEKK